MDDYKDKSDRDLLIEIHTNQKAQSEIIKDHEIRIRRGEKWRNIVMGACLTVGGGVGTAIGKVSNFIQGG